MSKNKKLLIMLSFRSTISDAAEALKQAPHPFVTMLENGSMSVEYYAPVGVDNQMPHKKDELYIIAKGSGIFNRNGEKVRFTVGDVLFVPAGVEHRFEEFSIGFATWVIFYGPEGGEAE